METQYSEDITLDFIAESLDMSSAYLSVYIKEKTGANFSDHMNRVRIQKAKELLTSSNLSIQNIGEQIGYRNGTSFIRMFKKITGETPGEFRRCQTI
jgi:YesN/AraC family two-component response regulator